METLFVRCGQADYGLYQPPEFATLFDDKKVESKATPLGATACIVQF